MRHPVDARAGRPTRERPRRDKTYVVALTLLLTMALPASSAEGASRTCGTEIAGREPNPCGGLHGKKRRACCAKTCREDSQCPGGPRTLAYVVTDCHQDAAGLSARQLLKLRQRGCGTLTVMEFPVEVAPTADCDLLRRNRGAAYNVGVFHRLGVAPDASMVVFEVNDDAFPIVVPNAPRRVRALRSEEKGIFSVFSDGTGLRKLSEPSRETSVQCGPNGCVFDSTFAFSADGEAPAEQGAIRGRRARRRARRAGSETIAFTDRRAGGDEEDFLQISTLDLNRISTLDPNTCERTQVTHLPPTPRGVCMSDGINTGKACVIDADCPCGGETACTPGTCFLRPGGPPPERKTIQSVGFIGRRKIEFLRYVKDVGVCANEPKTACNDSSQCSRGGICNTPRGMGACSNDPKTACTDNSQCLDGGKCDKVHLHLFSIRTGGKTEKPKQLDTAFMVGGVSLGALKITRGVTVFGQADLTPGECDQAKCVPRYPTDKAIREIFTLRGGKDLLLLTAFGRPDTGLNELYRVGQRVFFTASANVGQCVGGTNNGGTCDNHCPGSPPGRCTGGKNPSENCQLFSVDTLGGNLKQLTPFREALRRSEIGCNFGGPPGCFLTASYDAVTRTALLYSDCDPLSENPDATAQFFAGRADASRLRQLTHLRSESGPDGPVQVELIGQFTF